MTARDPWPEEAFNAIVSMPAPCLQARNSTEAGNSLRHLSSRQQHLREIHGHGLCPGLSQAANRKGEEPNTTCTRSKQRTSAIQACTISQGASNNKQ